jgi:hypothetical protein
MILEKLNWFYRSRPQGQYISEHNRGAECDQLVTDLTVILGYIRYRCLWAYETSQSLAIRDIIFSSHSRHYSVWPYKTSPSPAIQDISVSDCTRYLCLWLFKTSPTSAKTCICNSLNWCQSQAPNTAQLSEVLDSLLCLISRCASQWPNDRFRFSTPNVQNCLSLENDLENPGSENACI